MNHHTSSSSPTPGAPLGTGHATAGHPAVETWIEYHADELPDTERDRLQRHLSGCRKCVDLVLDLDAFAEPTPRDTPDVSDFEKAAVWRSLAADRKISRWSAVAAVAASLLFATVGFAWWSEQRRTIQGLEARVAELSRPQVNAVIQELRPSSRQRSARGADGRTDLPAGAGTITLILNLEEPVDYPDYELAILDAGGTEVWSGRGLEPSEFDNFYVAVRSRSLPAGEYDIQLRGLDDGQRVLLEVYPVRLR